MSWAGYLLALVRFKRCTTSQRKSVGENVNFPADVTTERGYRIILLVSMSNAVKMVSAVYLTGISELGWIFACFGEIQAMYNFAEKVGRRKCQFPCRCYHRKRI